MLGSKIDYKLNFDEHVQILFIKANSKLGALPRATSYNCGKEDTDELFYQRTVELLAIYMYVTHS